MYCTICGDGKEVFMCDKTGCFRKEKLVLALIDDDSTLMKVKRYDYFVKNQI